MLDKILDMLLGMPVLNRKFTRIASKFYAEPASRWEAVSLPNGTVCYLLKNDPNRRLVMDRMVALSIRCESLWKKLQRIPQPRSRTRDVQLLSYLFQPGDGVFHIAQKPPGGYDVKAYAQEDWIFIEIPTFQAVEEGSDGINVTEDRRRETLWTIVLHELAHVAGHWEHDMHHDKTIAWLQNVDSAV